MSILFVNIPYIKYINGIIHTGPNAGGRWPWLLPGPSFHGYACFPFQMGLAAQYLRLNGVTDVDLYDAVALKHSSYDLVRNVIEAKKPKYLITELAAPLISETFSILKWAKESFGTINIIAGSYVYNNEELLAKNEFIDYCITGEYDKATYEIILANNEGRKIDRIHKFKFVDDINLVNGQNFVPFRPFDYLQNYNEPTISTGSPQLQVSTSRGCPFKCIYCQWPKVFTNHNYRTRNVELVIDEIVSVRTEMQNRGKPIQSILFDDDTWNVGKTRVEQFCEALKKIGLLWSMMGRADILPLEVYDKMVDAGCRGMRFGIETFSQASLDAIHKNMNAKKNYESLKYILNRFSNLEFHFTTMKRLPFATEQSINEDATILNELKVIGERNNNRIHWQTSECIAYPGTDLFDLMKQKHSTEFDFTNPNNYIPGSDEYLKLAAKWEKI